MKLDEAIEHAVGLSDMRGARKAVIQKNGAWCVIEAYEAPRGERVFYVDADGVDQQHIDDGEITENWEIPHGNTGNKNAFKGVELDSIIRCRVNSHDKAGWVKTAADHGLNLSEWVVKTLNEQSDYK